jgi:hypothetical protein
MCVFQRETAMTKDEFVNVLVNSGTRLSQESRDFLEKVYVEGKARHVVAKDLGWSNQQAHNTVARFKKLIEKAS